MVMPSSAYWENGNLTKMVTNGSLAQTRLDDMATRIIASWHKYADSNGTPGFGMPLDLLAPHVLVDARDPAADETIYQGAVEGHVLVKNTNGALPLGKPKLLSLFGYDAPAYAINTPGTTKWSFGLENTQEVIGFGPFNDTYLFSNFLSSEPFGSPVPDIAANGTLISGGGSGATTPSYVDAPFNAFQRRAKADRTFLLWDFSAQAPSVDAASDACIVFINALASEGWDRPDLADDYSDTLVTNVAASCNNTIVVIHNAGVRLVDNWIENPNITAVIYAHMPGQETGQALVDIVYGVQSPSGRLPYTVAKQESDYGSTLAPTGPSPAEIWHTQDNFTEGVFIDYKRFIAQNITPRYAFGYGLTYSEFSYSGLSASASGRGGNYGGGHHGPSSYRRPSSYAPKSYTHGNATKPVVASSEGGDPSLFVTVANVAATVTNTGDVAAAEVAQLYLDIPGDGPTRVLRGFEKVFLQPGASAKVTFALTRKDVSVWDVVSQAWVTPSGAIGVFVGKSVLDIQLTGSLTL